MLEWVADNYQAVELRRILVTITVPIVAVLLLAALAWLVVHQLCQRICSRVSS